MQKIVLDTNMFLSAFVFGGMVETIVDLTVANKLQLYISPALVSEIFKKLHEFEVNNEITTSLNDFLEGSITVVPQATVSVCRDPKDNYLLELVQEAGVDYLITRDKDLLELPGAKWKDTKIVKPEEFLPILRSLNIANK